jgi:hypothetical protein
MFSQSGLNPRPYLLQEQIADVVAQRVVNFSEAIQVHDEQSYGFSFLRSVGNGLLQVTVKQLPMWGIQEIHDPTIQRGSERSCVVLCHFLK